MKNISRNAIIGYPAGIITGITYGLNPLFGVPLMQDGAAIESILFFRYSIAVLFLGLFLLLSRQSFRISWKQAGVLLVLGLLYTASSAFLFEAYHYIASGLATTLVFLYPVLVAIIMVFLRVVPSWPVWLSIFLTFVGVVIMTQSDYALMVGAIVFLTKINFSGINITDGLTGDWAWLNLVGLAVLPTVVSTATLAVATRNIGATKASVLGGFEPVTAILIGTIVFGEPLTTNIIVGILLSVVAIVFMILKTKR